MKQGEVPNLRDNKGIKKDPRIRDILKDRWKNFKGKGLLGIILVLTFIILSFVYLLQSSRFDEFTFTDYGEIGSFFSGITTPFLTIVAVFLAYLSFTTQSKQLEKQRMDAAKQRIGDIFFQLLNLHNSIVSSLEYNEKEEWKSLKKYQVENESPEKGNPDENKPKNDNQEQDNANISEPKSEDQPRIVTGRPFFNKVYNDLIRIYLYKSKEFNGSHGNQLELLNQSMSTLDSLHKDKFTHYYRNLYQLFKWVQKNNDKLSMEEQNEYIDIIRAQLSHFEIYLLYFNTNCYGKDEFSKLLDDYNFFYKYEKADGLNIIDRFLHDVDRNKGK
ncbi:putative phage abortive infection protein [Niallia sp. XMNu-256]|uniref:putative phage abortive infection protein n=1 Tax=Niallia sp. XMNu-256 TaxID=3082444 RepID=UPI0030D0033C